MPRPTITCTCCGKPFRLGAAHQPRFLRREFSSGIDAEMDACAECVGCVTCHNWPCDFKNAAKCERASRAWFDRREVGREDVEWGDRAQLLA